MPVNLRSLVPMAQVASVSRSIDFYAKLGFSVLNTFVPDGEEKPAWASLRGEGAQLMLSRREGPRSAGEPSVLFYLYCDDVADAHRALERAGVACGEIRSPFHSPGGEFEVLDPDGYVLMVTHT